MKKQENKSKIFGWVVLGIFGFAVFGTILSLSGTLAEIREVSVAKTPDAILASAGVSEEKMVSLPVLYYDQKADECVNLYDANLNKALYARQFEWTSCGYNNKNIESGLVEFELDDKYMPVAKKGKLTSNRGINFERWFNSVDGQSASYAGTLDMKYKSSGAEFMYEAKNFYPLDEIKFSADDSVNDDGHNHLFTMSFAVPFTVLGSGAEEFTITSDDDTFVFVGNELAIDMGGIHDATTGRFMINKQGEVYAGVGNEELAYTGINVTVGEGSIVRIFHADRDSSDSTFGVKFAEMNLSVTSTELAQGEVVQIAYDPSDPTYVAPLGESFVFKPDSTKGLIVMATIEGVMIVVTSILLVFVMRFMVKRKV